MLRRTKIVDLLKSDTTKPQVLAKGWVRTRRDAKDFSFIELNDGSSLKLLLAIIWIFLIPEKRVGKEK